MNNFENQKPNSQENHSEQWEVSPQEMPAFSQIERLEAERNEIATTYFQGRREDYLEEWQYLMAREGFEDMKTAQLRKKDNEIYIARAQQSSQN
ncbi:MAG: hypothetical protein Q4A21_02920 [bacterium]|nr:hypothetical protein [bacterium]